MAYQDIMFQLQIKFKIGHETMQGMLSLNENRRK